MNTSKPRSGKLVLWGAVGLLLVAAGALGGYALSQQADPEASVQVAMAATADTDCAECPNAGECQQCATKASVPVVDKSKCNGCTLCTHLAPNTFAMGEDGKAKVTDPTGDDREVIQGAMDKCKRAAITWN